MPKCATCGLELIEKENLPFEERAPCPQCGSLNRTFARVLTATVEIEERMKRKLKGGERTTSGKPGRELTQGDDFYRKTGTWNYLYRLIDRINNWYHEKITDLKTGKIIRECKGPLTEHQKRGSAKPKNGI